MRTGVAFSTWRTYNSYRRGDLVLVYAFNDSNSYLKKRMAMEMWVMYITNSHRITAHQGLVVRHRRMNELVMRASINRERSRQFWEARYAVYEKWKEERRQASAATRRSLFASGPASGAPPLPPTRPPSCQLAPV